LDIYGEITDTVPSDEFFLRMTGHCDSHSTDVDCNTWPTHVEGKLGLFFM